MISQFKTQFMKRMKISNMLLLGLSAAVITTSCNKVDEFGNTNINPNGATQPITAALLTTVESQIGHINSIDNFFNFGAMYSQYTTQTQYADKARYGIPQVEYSMTAYNESGTGATIGLYSGPMADCQTIINKNTDPATMGFAGQSGSNVNQIAVAKILKSYIIWTITDRWGDVPYSEALQANITNNVTPKYDAQKDIYTAMFKDLKDAVNSFDANGAPLKGDIIFGGDITKWKKTANSLRMLMALRLSKVYPNAGDVAATEFASANASGGILDNADNFTLTYAGGNLKNPYFAMYDGRSDYGESKTFYDILAGLGDTRQSAFGTSSIAFPYGMTDDAARAFGTANPGYSKNLAASFRTATSPIVIIPASIVLLARAEAIERGWITGSGRTNYEAAITQSFAQWGLTVPAGYLTSGTVDYDLGSGVTTPVGQSSANTIPATSKAVTANKIDRIALQRYIALYPDGGQAWAEWRRTGIPQLQPTTEALGKQIPRRYVYPVNERAYNPNSVIDAVAKMPFAGGDTQDNRVWWDKP
jgi:hypothetical protein